METGAFSSRKNPPAAFLTGSRVYFSKTTGGNKLLTPRHSLNAFSESRPGRTLVVKAFNACLEVGIPRKSNFGYLSS